MATRATVRFFTTVGCFGPGRPAPSFVGICPIMFAQRTQYPCCLPSWKSSAKLVLRLHVAIMSSLNDAALPPLLQRFAVMLRLPKRCWWMPTMPGPGLRIRSGTVLALCPTVAISSLGSGPPALQCRFRTCSDKVDTLLTWAALHNHHGSPTRLN